MKTLDSYTIFCTEAQTNKALELGAPIRIELESSFNNLEKRPIQRSMMYGEPIVILSPTAEQMIGYLETSREISEFDIAKWDEKSWAYKVHLKEKPALVGRDLFSSRPEATLAAIDAALDYLSKNKK